ncbi:MAG: pyridoxal phosphate-dependent aminotransferase [Tannerella sp.]|jgi:cystathionine beta-lyase|nr:pyridoxal phosphate-dependent aminotransferase [Tannerella sp.]
MIQYDFDELIDRKGTECIKFDLLNERYGREDLLALWVADMDFRTPDFIIDALKQRCEHPVFGYTYPSNDYYNSIINWVKELYDWEIKREWLSYIPGIVKGIAFVIDHFTKTGDKIIIQPPVYHPFRLVPEHLKREVVNNPLELVKGCYQMDFDNLESVIDEKCKILILSNPHNPGGIIWSKGTLQKLAHICMKHNILVVSDEIHAEMVYPGYTHYPFPTVSEEAASCSITFMAPSKTFNIAGIIASYSIIPDDKIRKKFYSFMRAGEFEEGSIFSYIATSAAYNHGNEWRNQMIEYVMSNVSFVYKFLKENIPHIKALIPKASFLVWLDCRKLGLSQKKLVDLFVNKARIALNDGSIFGKEGEGFMRINVGCSRAYLEQALNRLLEAVRGGKGRKGKGEKGVKGQKGERVKVRKGSY